MSVAVIPMAKELGWSAMERGLVSSSFFWGYSLTQIPAGWVSTRWGRVGGVGAAWHAQRLPWWCGRSPPAHLGCSQQAALPRLGITPPPRRPEPLPPTRSIGGARVLFAGVALWSLGTLIAPPAAKMGLLALCATRLFVGLGEGLAPSSATNVMARIVPE